MTGEQDDPQHVLEHVAEQVAIEQDDEDITVQRDTQRTATDGDESAVQTDSRGQELEPSVDVVEVGQRSLHWA